MTGLIGSALPCDCGHAPGDHVYLYGDDGAPCGYGRCTVAGCPCDGYGIALDADPPDRCDGCGASAPPCASGCSEAA